MGCCLMFLPKLQGSEIESLLEQADKMRGVLKTAFKGDLADSQVGAEYLLCRQVQFPLFQPGPGRGMVELFKRCFEGGKAHVAKLGIFPEAEIIGEIFFHQP